MNNYFRIKAFYPKENITFIIDSFGMFEKLWQFSAFLVSKGINVLEVSKDDSLLYPNIEKTDYDADHVILRKII